jgi:hypothetical protein
MNIERLTAERRQLVADVSAAARRLREIAELLGGESVTRRERTRLEAERASMIVEIEYLSERLIELLRTMQGGQAKN